MSPAILEQERPAGCLSDLAIERLLVEELALGPERDAIAGHLATCERCQRRRDVLASAPAHEPGLRRRSPSRSRLVLGAAFASLAAAASLALVLRPKPAGTPPELDGTRVKGTGVALEVVARRADGHVIPVWEGTSLRAGDAVRFVVTAPAPAHLAVVGLDSAGHVSIYAPRAPGTLDAVSAGRNEVPGSVVLDATPGEERFVALVCASPIDRAALVRAGEVALAAAGRPSRTGALDLPCRQSGVSVRKETTP